jgi:hypothetical protein
MAKDQTSRQVSLLVFFQRGGVETFKRGFL